MKAISELENIGYHFWIKEEGISYLHIGSMPDPEQVRPLLQQIKAAKSEAMAFLEQRPFTSKSKRRVIFPADYRGPFPSGTWQRMADGRFETLLCYDDLKEMLYWRDVVLADDAE
ncbi:MAG: hypothetical protein KJ063_23870 [Anaerolineae bacterium]|nr:hypothetical protein [Anaerolineae bacterium]